jgi:hypothetical protein
MPMATDEALPGSSLRAAAIASGVRSPLRDRARERSPLPPLSPGTDMEADMGIDMVAWPLPASRSGVVNSHPAGSGEIGEWTRARGAGGAVWTDRCDPAAA